MLKKLCIAALMVFSGSANAQIPVTDVAGLTQQMQQVVSWGQQLEQMRSQLQQQKATYESMSGSRGFGSLLNNPALRQALPQEWQKVYSAVQNGGYKGLTNAGKAIRDANKIYDCVQGTNVDTNRLCERQANRAAQDKAFAQDAYTSAEARLNNIEGLMGQINQTTDAKAIAELQARMQAEQAMIQNEQTKLQMFRMMAEAEKDLIEQQKRETSRKDLAKPSMVDSGRLQPVTFR